MEESVHVEITELRINLPARKIFLFEKRGPFIDERQLSPPRHEILRTLTVS